MNFAYYTIYGLAIAGLVAIPVAVGKSLVNGEILRAFVYAFLCLAGLFVLYIIFLLVVLSDSSWTQ
jgi:hypothetical protein